MILKGGSKGCFTWSFSALKTHSTVPYLIWVSSCYIKAIFHQRERDRERHRETKRQTERDRETERQTERLLINCHFAFLLFTEMPPESS